VLKSVVIPRNLEFASGMPLQLLGLVQPKSAQEEGDLR